ncbi:thiolase family protein [Pseudogracilibacillus auburnensis]|uniref:acetyl-CoA C-acetyltransferase n=1 Tax=Pseudogracilibacillus auburnensis TaxID=1494959 RepID=A0A2V3W7B5_9BACI|nr:thiolase family protein [Pseudogracilibacillus auburnensis]PXW90263.1 acetyl-CoA C-acetyltransferase [Pseudogracilibacillus auburnensis]
MQDAVIVAGVRTAVGAFGKTLKNVEAKELGRQVLEQLMDKTNFPKSAVEEVIFGHGYVHGGGLNSARIASQQAGFSEETPAYVVIKACGSSLKAITNATASIQTGQNDVIVVGGTESMSNVPYIVKNRWGTKFGNIEMEDVLMADGLTCSLGNEHMGVTAERLAENYHISREEQDDFAYNSHIKAAKAMADEKFQDEMVPIEVKSRKGNVTFTKDESVKNPIDRDKLATLKPVFKKGGMVTAGNACPMNDGAAALLMMSKERAEKEGLNPLVKVKAYASAGVHHSVMGVGPVPATKKALEKAGLSLDDIGLIELNEAFAAQALAVIKELHLDESKVNVNGGAIALGHPVGATGAKLSVTLIHEMIRSKTKYGLVTMCMAGGMGITVIYENMTL